MTTITKRRCSQCHEDYTYDFSYDSPVNVEHFSFCPYDGAPVEEYEWTRPVNLTKREPESVFARIMRENFIEPMRAELERSVVIMDYFGGSGELSRD